MFRNTGTSVNLPPQQTQAQPEDLSSQRPSPTPSSCSPSSEVGAETAAENTWPAGTNKLLIFCDIVLKHAGYPDAFRRNSGDDGEESSEDTKTTILIKNDRNSSSPLNSVGESVGDSSNGSELADLEPDDYDKEAYESISCWCGQPYAGRAMIECDQCLIWFHMLCEEVQESEVPELFHCKRCKSKKRRKRSSGSAKKGAKRRRTPATALAAPAVVTTTTTSSEPSSEVPPPLLQIEQTVSVTSSLASHETPNEAYFVAVPALDSLPGTSRASASQSAPKKKGRKRSASSTETHASNSASSSVTSNQQSENNSVPSTRNCPPLLPCYAAVTSSLPQTEAQETNRDTSDTVSINNAGNNSIVPVSQSVFSSLPVLEPQIGESDIFNRSP